MDEAEVKHCLKLILVVHCTSPMTAYDAPCYHPRSCSRYFRRRPELFYSSGSVTRQSGDCSITVEDLWCSLQTYTPPSLITFVFEVYPMPVSHGIWTPKYIGDSRTAISVVRNKMQHRKIHAATPDRMGKLSQTVGACIPATEACWQLISHWIWPLKTQLRHGLAPLI